MAEVDPERSTTASTRRNRFSVLPLFSARAELEELVCTRHASSIIFRSRAWIRQSSEPGTRICIWNSLQLDAIAQLLPQVSLLGCPNQLTSSAAFLSLRRRRTYEVPQQPTAPQKSAQQGPQKTMLLRTRDARSPEGGNHSPGRRPQKHRKPSARTSASTTTRAVWKSTRSSRRSTKTATARSTRTNSKEGLEKAGLELDGDKALKGTETYGDHTGLKQAGLLRCWRPSATTSSTRSRRSARRRGSPGALPKQTPIHYVFSDVGHFEGAVDAAFVNADAGDGARAQLNPASPGRAGGEASTCLPKSSHPRLLIAAATVTGSPSSLQTSAGRSRRALREAPFS